MPSSRKSLGIWGFADGPNPVLTKESLARKKRLPVPGTLLQTGPLPRENYRGEGISGGSITA